MKLYPGVPPFSLFVNPHAKPHVVYPYDVIKDGAEKVHNVKER